MTGVQPCALLPLSLRGLSTNPTPLGGETLPSTCPAGRDQLWGFPELSHMTRPDWSCFCAGFWVRAALMHSPGGLQYVLYSRLVIPVILLT